MAAGGKGREFFKMTSAASSNGPSAESSPAKRLETCRHLVYIMNKVSAKFHGRLIILLGARAFYLSLPDCHYGSPDTHTHPGPHAPTPAPLSRCANAGKIFGWIPVASSFTNHQKRPLRRPRDAWTLRDALGMKPREFSERGLRKMLLCAAYNPDCHYRSDNQNGYHSSRP